MSEGESVRLPANGSTPQDTNTHTQSRHTRRRAILDEASEMEFMIFVMHISI